jgi:hypothetical protein
MNNIPRPVILLPTQYDNVKTHIKNLQSHYFTIDNSEPGVGKTHMTSYVQQYMRFTHMLVVAPAALSDTWKTTGAEYGLPIRDVLTYEKLAGRSEGCLSHGLLIRSKDENSAQATYYPTAYLKSMIAQGLFVVFDEFQKIKNAKTSNYKSAASLIQAICGSNTPSRCIFLSASPFDGEEQKVSFMRSVNIIKSQKLSWSAGGKTVYGGLQELQDFCMALDAPETVALIERQGLSKNSASMFYEKIICKHLSSAAPPVKHDASMDCQNGYFNMTIQEAKLLIKGIDRLHQAANYDDAHPDEAVKDANWGDITRTLKENETSKIGIVCRHPDMKLRTVPGSKVIIFFNFTQPLMEVARILGAYNPLILNGKVPTAKRGDIVKLFQRPDLQYRVLLCNIAVGGLGLNLHDTYGGFPRFSYIMPGYKIQLIHQASGRTYRTGVKSNSWVRFVFGKCGKQEMSILNALAKHNASMRSSVPKQLLHNAEVKFPGDYPADIEPREDGCEEYVSFETVVYDDDDESEELIIPEDRAFGGASAGGAMFPPSADGGRVVFAMPMMPPASPIPATPGALSKIVLIMPKAPGGPQY